MTDETRYERIKRVEQGKARHQTIVRKLSKEAIADFEEALDKGLTPCRKAGLPTRWADWHSDPEKREDYEGDRPTIEEAWDMCAPCPMRDSGVCYNYALATSQGHGVWGGRIREDDKWVTK